MDDKVTFGVLGPVEVVAPGRPAATLPRSVRTLLARLAISPGRVVSVDALTDALWGEHLPGDAGNALQLRVSKLRRALAAAGVPGDVLVTRAPGYQLAVDADAVDALRFERLVSGARRCADADAPAALALLDEALALWRGPALADVGDAEWIEAESTRLEELRLGALEDRLDLLLELGRHAEAVADLERLVTLHPLRERVHRLLLVALYRTGRQAEALALYHQLRERLADELGIDPSPELQAVAEAILRQQVPAPRVETRLPPTPRRAPELPQRLSEVIGRQDDITAVLERLRHGRLVTLTGPGGVGKTTLATEVARTVADAADDAIADDVRLVRLAALEPGADVAEAVARQLGLQPPGPGEAAVAAALALLAPLCTLLVVDNCEHVVDSAAEVLERILQACPGVRVLATSREALAVAGEVQVAVHPLAVPCDEDDLTVIGESAAVRLFVERARAVRPGFALDPGSAPLVALICRQLDGVPLAIELAAARTKALPLGEIADRLGDRFALLTSGPRTSEARHRTLRATLDWSYELLSDAERALLRRLAVFRGGWTAEAAEEVCAAPDSGGHGLDRGDVLDLLLRLVDRSLVVADPDAGRFRMLVTIRDYGWARLREAGEADAVRDRHLRYFTRYAEERGSLSRWGGVGWAKMRTEHDNLRAAIDHALERARRSREPSDVDAGFRLANAMIWFWQYNVRYEGVAALTALLALPGGSPRCRGLALQGLALFHVYYPTPQSRAAARESLAILEEVGDVQGAAMSKLAIAWEAQYGGDLDQARALTAEAAAVLREDDNPGMWAQLHYVSALLDLGEGAFERSIEQWRLALEEFVRAGDLVIGSAVRVHLGLALRETGRVEEALAELRTAVELVWEGETMHGLAFALVHFAHTLLDVGSDGDVRALLDRADDVARRAQNPRCQAWAAWGRGRLALADGAAAVAVEECERAVALLEDREFPWARARLEAFLAEARKETISD